MSRDIYPPEFDLPVGPTDDEMLSKLDAYGHLNYTVGNEDWVACADFKVFIHPERDILVAYHIVVDCESAGFTDTPENGVFSRKELGDGWFPLWQYADICCEFYAGAKEFGSPDPEDVEKTASRWNRDLMASVKRAEVWLGSGEEIPLECEV